MENKAEFDLEKVFKFTMENIYNELTTDYYSNRLSLEDKKKVVECLLNEYLKEEDTEPNYRYEADKILRSYYECPIIGTKFITPITDVSALTEEERELVEYHIYDIRYVHLLYKQKNIRVIVRLYHEISHNEYWNIDSLFDFIYDTELTQEQRYQVCKDIYDMLLKEH